MALLARRLWCVSNTTSSRALHGRLPLVAPDVTQTRGALPATSTSFGKRRGLQRAVSSPRNVFPTRVGRSTAAQAARGACPDPLGQPHLLVAADPHPPALSSVDAATSVARAAMSRDRGVPRASWLRGINHRFRRHVCCPSKSPNLRGSIFTVGVPLISADLTPHGREGMQLGAFPQHSLDFLVPEGRVRFRHVIDAYERIIYFAYEHHTCQLTVYSSFGPPRPIST